MSRVPSLTAAWKDSELLWKLWSGTTRVQHDFLSIFSSLIYCFCQLVSQFIHSFVRLFLFKDPFQLVLKLATIVLLRSRPLLLGSYLCWQNVMVMAQLHFKFPSIFLNKSLIPFIACVSSSSSGMSHSSKHTCTSLPFSSAGSSDIIFGSY